MVEVLGLIYCGESDNLGTAPRQRQKNCAGIERVRISAMNPIREQLNRHKWELHDIDRVTLVVTHRGAPNDEAFVHGTEIGEIQPHGVQLAGEDGAFIPYHRIKRIDLRPV